MKRMTIISRKVLSRGKGRYFNEVEELIFLANLNDNQINKKLEELNTNKRTNFYEIKKDFNLKNKKDKIEFITYYLENSKDYRLQDLKNDVLEYVLNWR